MIALPTSPTGAFPLGERTDGSGADVSRGRVHRGREPGGRAGITVPCGFTAAKLPVGLQLTSRKMDEATLLQVAAAYQHATDWHERRPFSA